MVNLVRTRHVSPAEIVYRVRHGCVNEVVDTEEDMECNGNAETFSKVNSFELGHLEQKVEETRKNPKAVRNRGQGRHTHG